MQLVKNKTFAPIGLLLKDGSLFSIPPRTQADISGLDLDESYFQRMLELEAIASLKEGNLSEAKHRKPEPHPSAKKTDSPAE